MRSGLAALVAASIVGLRWPAVADELPPCFTLRQQDMGALPSQLYTVEKIRDTDGLIEYVVRFQRTYEEHELTGLTLEHVHGRGVALVAPIKLLPLAADHLQALFWLDPSTSKEVRFVVAYTIDKLCRDLPEVYSIRRFTLNVDDQ
jgi:hypothetical protein